MAETEHPAARRDRLSARIAAARARLAERQSLEWAEVGDLLDMLSHEINDATDLEPNDHAAAHGQYDRIEAQLDDAVAKLDADG
jgi:hypothetical protein